MFICHESKSIFHTCKLNVGRLLLRYFVYSKKSDYSTTEQSGGACISGFLLTVAFHVCCGVSAIYSLYINTRWCANSNYSTYICGNGKRADTWSTDGACELHRIDDYILPHWSVRWNMKVKGKLQNFFRDVVAFPPSRFLLSFTGCVWKLSFSQSLSEVISIFLLP